MDGEMVELGVVEPINLKDKLYRLVERQKELEEDKKNAVSSYNGSIKDIKDEISEVLEQIKGDL